MAENIPVPPLTPEAARAAQEVLLEQERVLRYPKSFGAREALALGQAAIDLVPEYESGYTVTITRELDAVWAHVPNEVPACGAFPVRVGDDWVATIAVSGLHDGLDHEVILRALERELGVEVPRWDAPVA